MCRVVGSDVCLLDAYAGTHSRRGRPVLEFELVSAGLEHETEMTVPVAHVLVRDQSAVGIEYVDDSFVRGTTRSRRLPYL